MWRVLTLLAFLFAALPADAEPIRVTDRVFLIKDRPGSTTRFEMIVNAGSSDEAGGRSRGLAHYLEHLVLVGRNAEHGDAAMRFFADASSNGWTSDKATVYLHTLPARAAGPAADLEKLFNFYASRLRDFAISDADAARERNVVLQEHDVRLQSNPSSLFYRQFNARVLPDHPSGYWTIGTRETIQSMTLEEARAFHAAWYAINNAWFVVRGDITPETLKAIADKALADLPAKILPERLRLRPPVLGADVEALRIRSDKVTRTLVTVARVVRVPEGDRLRQQTVAALLAAFMNSRFPGSGYDRVVESDEAASDDFSVYLREIAPATFALSLAASVAAGKTSDELKAAMERYIGTLASEGLPSEEQLARLKGRMRDASLRADKQATATHTRLVSWLAEGWPPEELPKYRELVASIGRGELAAFAAALTGPGTRASGILEPQDAVQ